MAQTPPLPFDVRAISSYTARNGNELSLDIGKVYRVLATDGRGVWWQSRTDDGAVGWFPANYTQVIESPPTPAVQEYVPPVTPHQPAVVQPVVQQQPVVVQQQPQQPASNGSTPVNGSQQPGSVPSDRGAPSKVNIDPVIKPGAPPLKDPCTVTVHLVESVHSTLASGKAPTFFIYKRPIINNDPKKLKPLFSISAKAKTGPWKWNEEFKLYIKDAEMEVVCLRFCAKNDFKSKGKDLIGELEFPLRGAVRKFDKPNGMFQWFPLKNGNDKVGESLLFIEYFDPRPFSGPSDVQHKGHVGLTSAGGFEIRDIPQEWKTLFRMLNIKKKDLENNAQMAQEVFDIMTKAVSEGTIPGSDGQSHQQYEDVDNTPAAVVTPVVPVSPSYSNTPVVNNNHYQPVPTPPPVITHQPTSISTPAPPPPPAQSTGPRPPPPPVQSTGSRPPPPPGPAVATASPATSKTGGGAMSFLEQIQRGTTLKPAQVKEVQAGTASTGNHLADTLLNAMTKYRVDIEGKDEEAADDWD